MNQVQAIIHSKFVIERHYPAKPEKVFAAFADPEKKRRWYAENRNHEVVQFTMDFRTGGVDQATFRMNNETPFPGALLTNRTTYQDIQKNERIVMAYTMAFGEKPFSASLTTIELVPNGSGTDLIFTEQGAFFEGSDGPQMREAGWTGLLASLANEFTS